MVVLRAPSVVDTESNDHARSIVYIFCVVDIVQIDHSAEFEILLLGEFVLDVQIIGRQLFVRAGSRKALGADVDKRTAGTVRIGRHCGLFLFQTDFTSGVCWYCKVVDVVFNCVTSKKNFEDRFVSCWSVESLALHLVQQFININKVYFCW